MRFTINDCLELASFNNAEVVCGKQHLSKPIKTVSVMEGTRPADIKKYGEGQDQLMLSSFFDIKDDPAAQKNAVKALAACGNVGLVLFNVGRVVKKLDKGVIETGEELGFPIIVMDPHSSPRMGDCINEITERILWGSGDKSDSLINNTIYHLLNFEKYSNFESAIRAAALANDFQVILLSENFNPLFSVETRYRATIDDAIKLGKERSVDRQSSVYTLINVNGVITYWGPVTVNGKKLFMFIVDNEDSYTAAEITKLAEVIELAMGMWRFTPERDVRAEFIKALYRGNTSLAYNLRREVDFDADRIVSAFFIQEKRDGIGGEVAAALEEDDNLQVISLSEGSDLFGLVLAKGENGAGTSCVEVFNQYKGNQDLSVFHISGISGIQDAADAFQLIKETSPFAGSVFPLKSVFTKYELVLISNCINIQLQGGSVQKNYLAFFQPFKSLGENKQKQLMDTLETFVLDAGMNNARTAAHMGIHTNTVQYRLKKIDDLMGAEITGNRVIPGLTIALALLRLERVVHH